jgi:O2-independent ubiquinone biosynthesis accessory factor UbiT
MSLPVQPLLLALRLIPDKLHQEILARVFTHLLRGQSIAGRLGDLQGKRIGIRITDAGSLLAFRIDGVRLRAMGRSATAGCDVTIQGTLADFWLLATRAEDPDTLFFNRRLSLEGDTETGLYIKNLLDALEFDWQAHVAAVLGRPLAGRLIPLIRKFGLATRLPPRAGA